MSEVMHLVAIQPPQKISCHLMDLCTPVVADHQPRHSPPCMLSIAARAEDEWIREGSVGFLTSPRTPQLAQKQMRYGQNMFVSYLLHFWADWGVLGLLRKPTDPSRIHSSSALSSDTPP